MSAHHASVSWSLDDREFTYDTYSRDHLWQFPPDATLAASAASEFLGSAEKTDPEQAFVAAVSSCHMLSLLAIAARRRLVVLSYHDDAVGFLEKNSAGRLAITRIELRPTIEFEEEVSAEVLAKLHDRAHHECFIANSVTTDIQVIG